MNYRHRFHAGNFADVVKHATLLRLIGAMQAKEKGFLYLDTHAGRGGYDLRAAASGLTRERAPEWPNGLGRVAARADAPPEVRDYVDAVRAFDAETRAGLAEKLPAGAAHEVSEGVGSGPMFYPGSPRLAQMRLRAQDRALLCERQPDEAAALKEAFAGLRRVSVQETDGYGATRAALPPPERRALVLIDPPFEAADEWARVVETVREGLRRLPAGVFAVWYPLTARARVDAFYRELLAVPALPPCFTVELLVAGEEAGLKLWGCGVLVINPPWGSAAPLDAMARWLAPVLAQGPGAQGGVHWLVPEK